MGIRQFWSEHSLQPHCIWTSFTSWQRAKNEQRINIKWEIGLILLAVINGQEKKRNYVHEPDRNVWWRSWIYANSSEGGAITAWMQVPSQSALISASLNGVTCSVKLPKFRFSNSSIWLEGAWLQEHHTEYWAKTTQHLKVLIVSPRKVSTDGKYESNNIGSNATIFSYRHTFLYFFLLP